MKSPNKIFIKRRTFWVIILPISVVTAVLLAVFLLKGGGSSRLDAYKRTLEQSGETLDIAKLAPVAPKENNPAEAFLTACKELSTLVGEQKVKPHLSAKLPDDKGNAPIVSILASPIGPKDAEAMTWEQVAEQHKLVEPHLTILKNVCKSPNLEFHPDYTLGPEGDIFGIGDAIWASRFLAQDAILSIHFGNIDAAIEDVVTLLAIAKVIQKQPLLISQLVSISIIGLANRTTWEIIESHVASLDQLAALQAGWKQVNILASLPATIRLERAWGLPAFSYPPTKIAQMRKFQDNPVPGEYGKDPAIDRWPEAFSWWQLDRHNDELEFISTYQPIIDAAVNANSTGSWKQFREKAEKLQDPALGLSKYNAKSFLSISNALLEILQAQEIANLTIAAIALERYSRTDIGYPTALEGLIPEYLNAVPVDPIDGAPLRYRSAPGGGYLLYAIGRNGTDDGGDSSPLFPKNPVKRKDIVWPHAVPVEELAQ